jgi:hypothetical protein
VNPRLYPTDEPVDGDDDDLRVPPELLHLHQLLELRDAKEDEADG